jgi:hypothetical protein
MRLIPNYNIIYYVENEKNIVLLFSIQRNRNFLFIRIHKMGICLHKMIHGAVSINVFQL